MIMNSFYTTFFDANLLYHVLDMAYDGRILIEVWSYTYSESSSNVTYVVRDSSISIGQ